MSKMGNPKLTRYARKLRREMTEEEKKLWYTFLRTLPVMIHRQHTIGNYIVDFYCASAKLVIELDGAQHYEDDAKKYDAERDAYLTSQGLTVLRYSNYDLNRNFKAICEDIWNHIFESCSPPQSLCDSSSPRRSQE